MSVINQMLKDLEARRDGERAQGNGVFADLTARDRRRPHRPLLPYLIIVVALMVLAGAGWVLSGWPTAPGDTPPSSTAAETATATADAVRSPPAPRLPVVESPQEAVVPTATAVAPAPQTSPVAPTVPAPLPGAPPAVLEAADAAAPAATAAFGPRPAGMTALPRHVADVAADAPPEAADPPIERRVRPLTPQQQAARAYQAGYAYLQDGRLELAEEQLRRALAHEPLYTEARTLLAALLMRAGRIVEAVALLDAGLALQPRHGELARLSARALMEQGNTERAVRVLEQAAGQLGAEGLALLAALHQRQGNFEQSIERYRQALARTPLQATWRAGLAISLEGAGRRDLARMAYRQSLEGRLSSAMRSYVEQRLAILEAPS